MIAEYTGDDVNVGFDWKLWKHLLIQSSLQNGKYFSGDFAAPGGTPIYAAASGYVQVAGWSSGGYGNYVIIYHGKMSDGNTYTTLYAHMRSVATSAGKYVKQGELIGYVGTTGNSTGNHLHLEVWKGGSKANAVNPRSCIPIPHN